MYYLKISQKIYKTDYMDSKMKSFQSIIIILLALIISGNDTFSIGAQADSTKSEEVWKKSFRFRVQLNQIYFDNWSKGGENTVNWLLNSDLNFTRQWKHVNWDNIYRFRYGQSKAGDNFAKVTDNEIDMRSDLIFKQRKHVNLFFGGSLKTQMSTGYNYENDMKNPRSDFLDPVVLTQNLGLDFTLVENLKLRISVDYSEKFADEYVQYYGIDNANTNKIEKVKVTKGMEIFTQYKNSFKEIINYDTVLEIDYNFENLSYTIINWRYTVDVKLIKNIGLGLDANFLYDKTQSLSGQFKQTFGISFIYQFE